MISNEVLFKDYRDCLVDVTYEIRLKYLYSFKLFDTSDANFFSFFKTEYNLLNGLKLLCLYFDKKIIFFSLKSNYHYMSKIVYNEDIKPNTGSLNILAYVDFNDNEVKWYSTLKLINVFNYISLLQANCNDLFVGKQIEDYIIREVPGSVLNHFKRNDDLNTFLTHFNN